MRVWSRATSSTHLSSAPLSLPSKCANVSVASKRISVDVATALPAAYHSVLIASSVGAGDGSATVCGEGAGGEVK